MQTIERKDVAITLRIRPQIGANGRIRMAIFQESSPVAPTAAAGTESAGPTTHKRAIETSVVVDDGKIVVLAGLIEARCPRTCRTRCRAKGPCLARKSGECVQAAVNGSLRYRLPSAVSSPSAPSRLVKCASLFQRPVNHA